MYGFKSVCFIKKAVWGGRLFLWAVGCKGLSKGHACFCGAGHLLFLPFFYFFVAFFLPVNGPVSCRGFFCKGVGGWGGSKVMPVFVAWVGRSCLRFLFFLYNFFTQKILSPLLGPKFFLVGGRGVVSMPLRFYGLFPSGPKHTCLCLSVGLCFMFNAVINIVM